MRIIADLHIHSRFSRATSKDITIANLEKWAKVKGVNLLGTGDFTHPEWFKEIKSNLSEREGILYSKTGFGFVLQTEISLIYSKNNKGRRVHYVVLAPGFSVAEQITEYLLRYGRVDYDGRPIFNIQSAEFVYNLKQISKDIEIIPAHVWTPWFGLFGSKSGYDSAEECFEDQLKHIYALETGLSSDPAMNWRLSKLDRFNLVSNSDLHSFWPWRIGREANVFELDKLTYNNLIKAIREKKGFLETIEFFPEEGKYHYDGHRQCGVMLSPKEAMKLNNICPVCKKPLTLGVLHRVEELADRPEGFIPPKSVPFKKVLPLSEVIALSTGAKVQSRQVWEAYNKLIKKYGNELEVLYKADYEKIKELVGEKIAVLIKKNRDQQIKFNPGYDGVYGTPVLDPLNIVKRPKVMSVKKQKSLLDF